MKRRESNSQLHDEVQVGRALKDVLQGDNVGVLDSEDGFKTITHVTYIYHQVALLPHNSHRGFPSLQIIGVKTVLLPDRANCEDLCEDLRGAALEINTAALDCATIKNVIHTRPQRTTRLGYESANRDVSISLGRRAHSRAYEHPITVTR